MTRRLIDISVPASDQHLRSKLRQDRTWLLRELGEHVRYARDLGFEVGVGADTVNLEAKSAITLTCGASSITLKPDGIEISSPKITSEAKGMHVISGALIKIN